MRAKTWWRLLGLGTPSLIAEGPLKPSPRPKDALILLVIWLEGVKKPVGECGQALPTTVEMAKLPGIKKTMLDGFSATGMFSPVRNDLRL